METIYNWIIMKNNTVFEYVQGSREAIKKYLKELRCKDSDFQYLAIGSHDAFIDTAKYKKVRLEMEAIL